jgi:hypothetical protein
MILPCRHHYVPYREAAGAANIVIDGTPNDNTALPLSHWPKSGTPWELKADTSVEVVFNYLDSPGHHVAVAPVTNDHFDEDGMIGLWCMIHPEAAQEARDLLCDASRVGDFATYRDRRAARMAFAISRLVDRELSPWGREAFPKAYPDYCAMTYSRLLEMFCGLLGDLEGHRSLWEDEDALLSASEKALECGEATIEEIRTADLAVVRVPPDWPERPAHRFTQQRRVMIHPMAVHNQTASNRVVTFCGDRVTFTYRYESWVQMVSHRPPARVDLKAVAGDLTEREAGGHAWSFDGVEQIVPLLTTGDGRSGLSETVILDALVVALEQGAPAWDPYDTAA